VTSFFRQAVRDYQYVFWLALLTIAFSIGWFFLDGNVTLNLADEGALWYGSEAIRLGQIPIRDFQSYDPGRFLWVAAWSYFLGHGVVSLRLSCVIFQCFGVLAGLLTVRRLSRHWLFLSYVALLLCIWMHPRYKVFEQSIALMAVYAGTLLLERPTVRRHWWVGVFGGLSAFFGRNHGAYHVFAFGILIAFAAWGKGWRPWVRCTFAWVAGLLTGYLPQWLMYAFVPGYFRASIQDIAAIFKNGTNLSCPVPWPWLVPKEYPFWLYLSGIAEGCLYLALPLFLVLAAIRVLQLRKQEASPRPVIMAALCVSLPYTHYVFSRPDIVHLSHGMPTIALAAIAAGLSFWGVWRRLGYVFLGILLSASVAANLFGMGVTLELLVPDGSLVEAEIKGERMLITKRQFQVLASASHLANDLAKPDEQVFFMPLMPTLYPFTGRLSPTKRIYFLFPSPEEDQELLAEIEHAGVQWVMLQDYPLDGRDDLRFRNTNPKVCDYFRKNYGVVPMETLPRDMVVLRRSSKATNP
jgi:hypothetical protein